MSGPDKFMFFLAMLFAGVAALVAVGGSLADDDAKTEPGGKGKGAGKGKPPGDSREKAREGRPVHLSVSAGDAEFEPAKIQGGALRTRFTVKSDEVELKGSFQVDIVGGDDAVLKQRVVRYRPLLLAILKRALRAGPPVRSAAPVVSSLKPVGGSADVVGLEGDDGFLGAFAGNTLVVCGLRGGKTALLSWSDLDAPPKMLHEVGDRRVIALAPSPDGARIAVVFGAARRAGVPGSDPTAQLVVIDVISGVARTLLAAGDAFRFHVSPQLAWSTGADRLAIEGVTPGGRSVKVLDPATAAPVGETAPAMGATLVGWERDDRDAVLVDAGGWHRWRPGAEPERVHLPYMMSPDTRFMLVVREIPVEEGSERVPYLDIVRRDQGSWTPMEGEEPDELARDMLLKDVLEHRVRWIGEHGALMYAPEPMVLDLDSLAARYLCPPMPGVTFVGASPAGRVVVRDGANHLHWGTAAAWT